ncbi:MAG: aldo/keto reductase [Anaerolineae bacterium]|nr:aldo/keto reductase [Anaerolineae bacterium]
MEYVAFGNTGLTVSRLAIGTGTHGFGGRSEQSAIGVDALAHLLHQAYEHGVTFWDAADGYGTHPQLARALRLVPREKVVIATKTMSHSGPQVTRDIERFLRELRTDVLDIVLMHCITQPNWEQSHRDAMAALSRAKEQGKIRAVGISCHNLGALRAVAHSEWADVVLARINYAGTNMDASPEQVVPVLERIYAAGKAVYGMKVLGCGSLARQAADAVRYVLELGTVHAMTIGLSKTDHLAQSLRILSKLAPAYPLRSLEPSTRT